MTRVLHLPLALLLALSFTSNAVLADDDKELRKQRQAAHKERSLQKKERSQEINDAKKAFKEYARELKKESKEAAKELDTEFKLRRVELEAEHDAKVAEAEAEYQKRLMGLFMTPGVKFDEQALARMQEEGKSYSDELFALQKQSAEALHQEQISNEQKKNELLTERDRQALAKASELGLTREYAPILAAPIGDGLTKREEKWNAKEQQEVVKLQERNRKMLREFRNGERLRSWEIQNLNADFKLTWDEKAELHALDSQQLFFNAVIMQAAAGGQIDQQGFMTKITEINKQKKLINIEYKKIRDQNRIKRRKEKKEITEG